jgi:hypothetical protein
MKRITIPIALALLFIASADRPVCWAAKPAAATDPSALPDPVALGDERAYAIEMLAVYADAAAYEARILTKGAAATYFRMKVVELDQLEYRILAGEPVKYREISDAIDPLAARLSGY